MRYFLEFAKSIHSVTGKILYMNLFGTIVSSMFESFGIFMIIPLISISGIINGNLVNFPQFIWINPILNYLPSNLRLIAILFIYVTLVFGYSIFQRYQTILNTRIQFNFMRYLREEMYIGLVQSNWGLFLKKKKSDIVNAMTTEISRVAGGTYLFLQFITSILFTIVQIIFSFWLSTKMTIAILLFGSALIVCSRSFINKSSKIGEETVELSKHYLAGITDHFNGIKEIKSNSLEESHFQWVKTIGTRLEKNVLEISRLNSTSQFIFKVVSSFLIAGFIFCSIDMFHADPAQLMLIFVIFTRLWPRFSGIQSNLEQLGAIVPAFKQLTNLRNECLQAKEVKESERTELKPLSIKEGIECRNVSFRYNIDQPLYALQNISAFIPSNQMTAFVGKSGAGKSTLIDLIMGLNQPEKGEVLIDGIPLTNEYLILLRRQISYVPQDPFLFNATIRENLMIMDPNATEEQIWEALEFSSAAEFVSKLPQGLDTLVGDRGVRLSGGERQRLVLARAILRKPSILVLDEATSALDTDNEAKIQLAIERLKGRMTIIVIAHRLSTIRNANQVIVLDQGKIVQKGMFNQLAKEKKGMFNKLLNNQIEVNPYRIER